MSNPNVGKFQCPRCAGPIPSAEHVGEYPGAISRWDNDTEVCSQCGQDEAMAQFTVGMRRGADRTEVLHPTRGLVRWAFPPDPGDGYGVGKAGHDDAWAGIDAAASKMGYRWGTTDTGEPGWVEKKRGRKEEKNK